MRYLLITADDYGMSRAVNDGIVRGVEAGVITTANVMTNMPLLQEAGELRRRFPSLSIGLHWNLTEGKSVLAKEAVATLVDQKGTFFSASELKRRRREGKIEDRQVLAELKAQYQKFYEIVGAPDYWNTHEHVHFNFGFFELFTQAARELGIQSMRCNRKIPVLSSHPKKRALKRWLLEPAKRVVMDRWYRRLKAQKVRMPDGMLNFRNLQDKCDFEAVVNQIQWGKWQTAELVLHPATSVDSPHFGNLTEKRVEEYRYFCRDGLREKLETGGFQLAGYEVLK